MSRQVPVLTETELRAWGIDDEAVVSALAHENQPGRNRRARAVGERAKAAGWPVISEGDARRAATAALRRLEPVDCTPQGLRDRHRRRVAAAADERRRQVVEAPVASYTDDDGPVSIFDE